jgi:hypothetical protein
MGVGYIGEAEEMKENEGDFANAERDKTLCLSLRLS